MNFKKIALYTSVMVFFASMFFILNVTATLGTVGMGDDIPTSIYWDILLGVSCLLSSVILWLFGRTEQTQTSVTSNQV
jgi:hypothetical protein